VIYAGTAYKLATLKVEASAQVDLKEFSEIRYPPVASVVLGFRREDVQHPCEGFGMLIPKIEGFKILGTIFSSSLFPNRAPAGHLTLTSYVGGERYPELAQLPPDKLFALTIEDLRVLLGVRGQPTFQHIQKPFRNTTSGMGGIGRRWARSRRRRQDYFWPGITGTGFR
jgi:oxygen-dependent protoporphyrinogen oxidase